MERFLILGNGYVGGHLFDFFKQLGLHVVMGDGVDIADADQVQKTIQNIRPTSIINCAAKTGNPNVDACENDAEATYRSNVLGALTVGEMAFEQGIHFTQLSSGCIFNSEGSERLFSESDPPNFLTNTYLRSKILAETALLSTDALILRLRMPISSKPHRRNLLTKILNFKKIMREPNSATIIEDFCRAAYFLVCQRHKGLFHVVNPGPEYHDDLLKMIEVFLDKKIPCDVTTFEQIQNQLNVKRSNCLLSSQKLLNAGFEMPPFSESIKKVITRYPFS